MKKRFKVVDESNWEYVVINQSGFRIKLYLSLSNNNQQYNSFVIINFDQTKETDNTIFKNL